MNNKNENDAGSQRLKDVLNRVHSNHSSQRNTQSTSNMIDNSSTYDEDLEDDIEQEQEQESSTVMDEIKNNVDQAQEKIEKAEKTVKMGVNIAKNWKLYLILAAVVVGIFMLILVISVFKMLSIDNVFQYINEKATEIAENVSLGVEKTFNLLTGQGWTTEDEAYNQALSDQYDNYKLLKGSDGLDIALIAATINYGRVINPNIWTTDTTVEESSMDYSSNDGNLAEPMADMGVDDKKATDFYRWANIWVGNMTTTLPWNRGLTGALVSMKIANVCVDDDDANDNNNINLSLLSDFGNYGLVMLWGTAGDIATDALQLIVGDTFTQIYSTANTIGNSQQIDEILSSYYQVVAKIDSFNSAGNSANDLSQEKETFGYSRSDSYDLSSVDKNLDCNDETIIDSKGNKTVIYKRVATRYTAYNDYEKYKSYLKNFFIPRMYLDCGNCSLKDKQWEDGEKEKYIDQIINQIFEEKDQYNLLAGVGTGSITEFHPGEASCPLESITTSSTYGERRCYTASGRYQCDVHRGIDIPKPLGTPIYSIGDGTVVAAGLNSIHWSYGIAAKIGYDDNNDGAYDYYVIYAHMSEINVAAGQQIGGGQVIGKVGSTGNSTGPHLHFEINSPSGEVLNPTATLNGLCGG